MEIVSKEKVVMTIENLLSTLDLLESQVTLRVNHVLTNKENDVIHSVEIIQAYVGNMEETIFRLVNEGRFVSHRIDMLAV
ncbi:hypothetical protein [Ectobacillus sp. sgz5001026]|uniref:hypothetical protein n=1 Tax=Ectobacillus sp. sgz5001026 TaxID=3242473 RepID=UPI0036D43DB5